MQTIKQEAIEAITKLPDSASMEDIMYRLYVLDKIRSSQQAVRNGRVISVEDLKREALSW